jgi:hypothetical protein
MSQSSIDTVTAAAPPNSPASTAAATPPKTRRAILWSRIAGAGIVVLLVLDVVSRLMLRSMESPLRWAPKDWGVYALGLGWSAASWFLMPIVLKPLLGRSWPRRILAAVAALWLAIVLLATLAFRVFTEQSPSWQALRFLVDKPDHAYELGRQWLGWLPLGASLLTVVALYHVGAALLEQAPERPRRKRWRALIAVAYAGLTVMLCITPGMQSPLPIEALGMTSFGSFGVATLSGERHLVTPVRPPVPPAKDPDAPSVLLLFHESLSSDAVFAGLDYPGRFDVNQTAPFTSKLLGRESEGFFVLPQARSNATATESSVPTVLSGVDLGGPTDAYGTAQSIWSLGKATGAATFLFSACSYNWSHFDEFFVDKNVDYHRTGLELGPKIVNDSGIDDRLMVDASLEYLRGLIAEKKRFVGVLHFDATHLPGYWGPGSEDIDAPQAVRYPKAARYVDAMNKDIVETVLGSSARDNTIIIATSDHGEQIPPKREPNRLGNYYERTVRIPVWLYVPPKVLEKHPEYRETLLAWKAKNAQNMDVLPTVRDFLTLPKEPPLDLPGRSWLAAPPAVDQMAGQSTTSFRAWNNEGFFVVRERLKVIVSSESPKPEIYDLSKDPGEERDLWKDAAIRKSVEPWVRELVKNGQERRILCERLGETRCPYL